MPTIYPLLFNDGLFESEIEQRECGDGVYVGKETFKQYMSAEDTNEIVLLRIEFGERFAYCHIYGTHNGDDDIFYAPAWVCGVLGCDGGEEVELDRDYTAIGNRIKIKPHTSEYAVLDDPVSALRDGFENYSCIAPGVDLPLMVGGKRMVVSVLDTHYTGPICIRGVELEVEIERPMDSDDDEDDMVEEQFGNDFGEAPTPVEEDFGSMLPPDPRFPGVGYRLG